MPILLSKKTTKTGGDSSIGANISTNISFVTNLLWVPKSFRQLYTAHLQYKCDRQNYPYLDRIAEHKEGVVLQVAVYCSPCKIAVQMQCHLNVIT